MKKMFYYIPFIILIPIEYVLGNIFDNSLNIFIVLGIGIIEEVMRSLLINKLINYSLIGIIVISIINGLLYYFIGGNIIIGIVLSLMYSLIYIKTKCLILNIMSHSLLNVVSIYSNRITHPVYLIFLNIIFVLICIDYSIYLIHSIEVNDYE